MRDHLVLYINGQRRIVHGRDALLSLSDYLRRRLGLIGTKIVCSEGDCGACTVLIGRTTADGHRLAYRPVDACIQFMFQLDGTHVVTVEGLRADGQLNPVQQALVDCHGSQCGFCTPGFVMAMTGLLEDADELDEPQLRTGLTGNLCRCTGYTPILEAGMRCHDQEANHERLSEIYEEAPILADLKRQSIAPIAIECEHLGERHIVACPTMLAGALDFLAANPTATIVAGATDIGVRINKTSRLPPAILDLNRLGELDYVRTATGQLHAGARATWTSLLQVVSDDNPPPSKGGARGGIPDADLSTSLNGGGDSQNPSPNLSPQGRGIIPEFARILSLFGAPQIRHVGTIAGNIANASPIADSLPFLFVMEATVVIASRAGRREVNINDFYHGYKKTDLRPGELIAEVRIPLPEPDDLLRLYKVSRRRDLDIAGFTAALRLRLSGETIKNASVALGAVGPVVLRARQTEQFLTGKPLTEATLHAAGALAVEEITPIDDVRGSANYRRQLTQNMFLKFYHQTQGELVTAQ